MSAHRHVMVDLETLGVGYRALIVSIGAVEFVPGSPETGREFYAVIDTENAQREGMRIDASAVMWWLEQSDEARAALQKDPHPLTHVLVDLATWLPKGVRVWGNGSNFDNRILREAYDLIQMRCPWHYRDDRDMRTYMDGRERHAVTRGGTHHNALDDAIFQVQLMAK